jgi:hypothetical protein
MFIKFMNILDFLCAVFYEQNDGIVLTRLY